MSYPSSLPRRLCAAVACLLMLGSVARPTRLAVPVSAIEGITRTVPAEVTTRLIEGLAACESSIDLTAYAIPTDGIGSLYAGVLRNEPALFHVAPRLSYGYAVGAAGEMVTRVYPTYTLTGQDLQEARLFYRDTIAALADRVQQAAGDGTLNEAEAVLYIHDLLADEYEYDTRPDGTSNSDAYRFLRDGVGICQAYALTFLALCRAVGLEADFVASPAMDHAWNHVRVDGVWYHVDVTRDDPIPAPGGDPAVTHTRYLRSDAGMAALGYHDYTCSAGHACPDTRYETADGTSSLAAYDAPLLPVTVSGQRMWVAPAAHAAGDYRLTACRITTDTPGTVLHQPWDMDGDGRVTPADLLALYAPTATLPPEAWREEMRRRVIEAAGEE